MSNIEKAVERLNRETDFIRKEEVMKPFPPVAQGKNPEPSVVADNKPSCQLDFQSLKRAGYLTPDGIEGRPAEQYRLLKRPLLNNAFGRDSSRPEHGNLIAITSALQKEGKTFTAFNLAMSIAMERDRTVLLVDGDLIRRSLTHLVGLEDVKGLADLLIDPEMGLQDVITGTNVPKLNLLPAGRTHRDATELLASNRMHEIVEELANRYSNRIIVFDTSPLLASSQAIVLVALMGQIIVVVEEGRTPRHAIQDSVALLDRDKSIGLVLNKSVRLSGNDYYPYYGAT